MPKAPLTCKQILAFMKDEYHANKEYTNLGYDILNSNHPNVIGFRDKMFNDFSGMGRDEKKHHDTLKMWSESLQCDQNKWFTAAVSKLK